MFYKSRTEPADLFILRSLATRKSLSPKEEPLYFALNKGFEGEILFDSLTEKLQCECLILNDLLLKQNATIFQTRVPKDFHGRFFSFRNMLDRVTFQIVLLMTGFLLDTVGLQQMSVIFGALSLIMTASFYLKFKQLRTKAEVTNKVS